MVATRELGIRLSVKDADVVRRALEGLGTEGQQSLRRIERASKPASRGLKAVNTAAREGQAALHGYAAQAGPLGLVLSSIGPAGLAVGAGLGIAAGAAILLVGDFAQLAERAKVMRESFERMAESRGSNPVQLMEEISEATRGTLDQIKALTVANTALSSGIEPLYKNLGQIIRDTRSVSTALGRNASQDIERVISAINKQEQELLDELGIVARAETAYKAYAAQLGTTASKLDDLQKRTAFANLVIGQLREKAEAVGDPIDRVADGSARFNTAWVALKLTLGGMVETGGVLDKLASGIEAVNEAVKELHVEEAVPKLPPSRFTNVVSKEPLGGPGIPTSEDIEKLLLDFGKLRRPGAGIRLIEGLDLQVVGRGPVQGGRFGTETGVGADLTKAILQGFGEVAQKGLDLRGGGLRGLKFEAPFEQLGPGGPLSLGGAGTSKENIALLRREAMALAKSERELLEIRQEFEVLSRRHAGASKVELETLNRVHQAKTDRFDRDELADHTARNFEAETILAKKRRDIRLGEITDTDELARVNLRWRHIQLETQLKAVGATKEQFAVLEQLNADHMRLLGERQDAANELADAEKKLADGRRELNQAVAAGIRLAGVFSPTIAELATSVVQMASGDVVGGIVTGFLTLGSAIQDAQRQNLQYRESLDEIRRATAEAATEFNRIAIAIGGPFKDELLAMQTEAVQPLLRRFQEMRALAPVDESVLTTLREFMSILQDAGTDLSDLNAQNLQQLIDPFGMGDVTDEQIQAFQRGTIDPIFAAFGDLPIDQFVREMFALGTGFKDVAESVTVLRQDLGPLERQIRSQFDFSEIRLRSQAQRRFQTEGADTIGQNRVLKSLESQLSAVSSAEVAMLSRLQRAGVADQGGSTARRDDLAKVTAAPADEPAAAVPVGISLTSLSVKDFEELIQLPDWSKRIEIAWEDAVHINDKYGVNGRRPEHWDDIVRVPGRDARVTVNWEDAVHIKDKYGVGGNRPQGWADVVSRSKIDEMKSIEKKWSDAISISRASLSDYGVRQWSDIVRLERASQSIGGSYSHTPGLSRHQRSWAQAIDLRPADLSDYGINRWSQMVLLSRESGGLSKHTRSFADLVDIRPTRLSVSSMIRLQPVRVTAAQLIKVAGRLKLSDLIDLSELDRRIDSRVARQNDKARYRDDPIGFAAG